MKKITNSYEMNLNQLKIFHAAAKAESFTQAAESLCLTQPGISKHIKQFENDMGIRLFDRLGKKVIPTQAGRILLETTRTVFETIDEARARIDDLRMMQGGTLSIGASYTAGTYVIPEILGRFHRQYPDVEIRLDISLSSNIARRVGANEIDIGFLGAPYTDNRLTLDPFYQDKAVVIIPRDHPWQAQQSICLTDLAGQPFILSGKGSGTRTFIITALKSVGVTLNKPLEFGNTEAVKKAVENGMGISVMSSLAVQNEITCGQLIARPFSGSGLERTFFYSCLKDKYKTHAVRALIKLLDG